MRQRWQTRREQVSHLDDWLITYADMITLLLCFFALFLSLSIAQKTTSKTQAPEATVVEAQKEAVPEREVDPLLPPAQEAPPQPLVIMGNLPFHDPQDERFMDRPLPELPQMVAKSEEPMNPPPPKTEEGGDRITTMELSSAAFFDPGSAALSQAGKEILHGVASDIGAEKFKDYQITVEGHTDDTPIQTTQFPSNWELSTARASAVVHFFLESGLPAQRLRAAGYADTFPKLPNRDANGYAIPENQTQNRRVVIKLEKVERRD